MNPRRRYTTRLLAGFAFACFAVAAPPASSTPSGLTPSGLTPSGLTPSGFTTAASLTTTSSAPNYTAAGIVNAATQNHETLAPNTVATIYGTNLSWTTHALAARDLNDGTLPTSLEGVSVYVNGILSNLYFVSPGQINFLIPYDVTASTAIVYVARQGVAGPGVKISLAKTSPGFFEWNGNYAVAQHVDGTLISASDPAMPGEVVVLYAGGLGRTLPDIPSGHIVTGPTSILYESELQILLNGDPCPASSIYYAGLAPDYAGLYQINLLLPDIISPDPAIQMVMGTQSSPASVLLYVQ